MKTAALFLACLCWLGANATIWRINSNPQVNAHFIGINEAVAHWTVNNGDTLYLENGSYFPASTITKTLTIIGPGFFLLENDSTYANPLPALIQSLNLSCSGSKITGVKVIGNVSVNGNNNIIERCALCGTDNGSQVYGLIIRQCYVAGNISSGSFMSTTINNNIVTGIISLTAANSSHNIYNNVICYNNGNTSYALTAINSSVINNIIIREPVLPDPNQNRTEYCIAFGSGGNANSSFARNLMSQSPSALFPQNLYNQVKEDIFKLSGSTDENWQLKSGSPAIGYGSNGDDCGAFGGPMHYVLSGLPWLLPRIIEADIPSGGNGNLIPVHIVAKTQEE
jgi:hypothetical protein